MELLTTNIIVTVSYCRTQFQCDLLSALVKQCSKNFVVKCRQSDNV